MSRHLEGASPCDRRTCQGLLDFQHDRYQVHDDHDVGHEYHMLQLGTFRTEGIEALVNVAAGDSSESQEIFVVGAVPVVAGAERQLG